jgi:type 1 fimbria pilin
MSFRFNLLCASLITVVAAPAAMAERLEITGELMTSTCAVGSSGGAITVPMGKVDLASVNANTRAGQKNFSISLDCTGSGTAQEVGVRFGGTPHGSTGNLALTATSVATNVGVALYDANGDHQKIGDDPSVWVTIAAGGSGQLDYSAWYASPSQDATQGIANASGDFVVLYK